MLKATVHNIVFICSSLEPGADGVGDYTRKLASALIKRGHKAAIIAINDRRMEAAGSGMEDQQDDGVAVPVLRLSASLEWTVRLEAARQFIQKAAPDYVSIQYVPFGYQLKGLPFGLSKKMKMIAPHARWHVMFHELDVNKDESLKYRLWSFLQVQLIRSFLKRLKPVSVTTNTAIYSHRLTGFGYDATVLPLFSNITPVAATGALAEMDGVPEYLQHNREDYLVGTIFGSLALKSWDLRSLLDKFPGGYKGKKVVIASVGKMPAGTGYWDTLQQQYPHILFLTLGMKDAAFISVWLSTCTDFGILTTLPELAGKSGSFMAFKAHGVPVVCKAVDDKTYPGYVTIDHCLTPIHNEGAFELPAVYKPINLLPSVAGKFTAILDENMEESGLNILILSHRFNPDVGGIETNTEILAAAFHNYAANVHVMTWTQQQGNESFPFTIVRNPGLQTIIKEHRWADIIFENNPCLRLSWINLFLHKPLVIAVNTWINRPKGNKGLRDKLKNLWFRRAASVIAVSEAIRKREWPKAVVIENPYNNLVFTKNTNTQRTIPFVFLGRLVSDKGADQAILAIAALLHKNVLRKNGILLTIIGDGPERPKLQAMVKKLKLEEVVVFKGVLRGNELVNNLGMHRFILVPSIWEEPYGNVVLEGMACGCVPVASAGGGLPEAVGKAGLLFKRKDPEDMVRVITDILNKPEEEERLRCQARKHLETRTMDAVSSKYFDILKKAGTV